MQKINKLIVSIVILIVVAVAAYWLGQEGFNQQPAQPVATEITLKEINQIQDRLKNQHQAFEQQLQQIQTNIATVKAQSQNLTIEPEQSTAELEAELQQVKQKIDVLSLKQHTLEVPIPPESPSGKVLNQAKTASGVSVPMLENYQRETGVDPQEVEALMQK